MRIALVHPFAWPEVCRGGERYLHDLAWYLAGAGHEVDVVTGTYGAPGTSHDGAAVVRRLRHRRLPVPSRARRRVELRHVATVDAFGAVALPTLRRRRYDLVHALTPTAAIAARLAGHRTVYTVLGHPDAAYLAAHRFEATLFHAALRAATVTTVLSESAAAALAGVTSCRVEVLPPGVRADAFPPDLTPRTGPPVVLFPSDLSERRKGLDVALRAVAHLRRSGRDARVVLAGPGDPRWALDEIGADVDVLADALDVVGAGELADLPGRYRAATVTVLPSGWEAFGLVLVESLASGTPVVATRDGGMREIVTDPAVGRLVAHRDHEALAAAVADVAAMAAHPATPARCAAHAARWDWRTSVGPAHEALYRSVARALT